MALSDGLIGYWSPWQGSSGYRLIDRSPRANHGILTNMDAGTDWVGATIRGQIGYAIDFDGSNDFVPLTPANLATYATSRACFLIWVYPRTTTRNCIVADFNSSGAASTLRMEMSGFSMTSGRIGGELLASSLTSPVQTSAAVTLNQWHCIAIQRTGAGLQLFWNGFLDASNTLALGGSALQNPITLGRSGSFNANFSNIQVAEFSIWNRELSGNEHLELFRLGPGWYRPYQRKRYAFVGGVTFNRRRRILCGDYS